MMEERIIYDVDDIQPFIDQELDELRRIRFSERYTKLLGEDFMKKVKKWENAIRIQKDLPYTIVVCGSFKRGKSTLINALLGEDIVTTDITTETITLNKVSYGEHSNALILDNGKRMLLTDEQLHREELEKVLSTVGKGSYQLDLRRPIDLLKEVTIIDSPGMDDALGDFDDMVNEALMQADAVIYVFSSSYPLSIQEQLFLRTSILPQSHTELFLVSNYADMLRDPAGYKKMQEEIAKRTELVLPGQKFYMLSALDERCRQIDADRPSPQLQDLLADNFTEFRNTVGHLVEEKKNTVLLDRMERMLKGMRDDLYQSLDTIVEGLQMDKEQIYTTRQEAQKELESMDSYQIQAIQKLTDLLRSMAGESTEWMDALIDQMREESRHLENVDIDNVRKYYSLYCVDTLQKGLNLCMEHHYKRILDELNDISTELSRKVFDNKSSEQVNFQFAINNKTWTKGDNVGFFVNDIGGILGIAGKAVAGTMRQHELKNRSDDVYADIQEQYSRLSADLPNTVKKAYDVVERSIMSQVKGYFSDQAESLQEKTDQVTLFDQRSEEEKEESMQLVEEVRRILEEMVI